MLLLFIAKCGLFSFLTIGYALGLALVYKGLVKFFGALHCQVNSVHHLEAKSLRGFCSYLARATSSRSPFPPGGIEGRKRSESFMTTKFSLFISSFSVETFATTQSTLFVSFLPWNLKLLLTRSRWLGTCNCTTFLSRRFRWPIYFYKTLSLSTRLIKPNFCFHLSHRRSTTVSLETRNPIYF